MAVISLSAGAWTAGFAAADLNGLANGGQKTSSLASPHVDNTAGQLYAQFEVTLGGLSPAAGAHVLVVLIPETQTAGAYVAGADGTAAADQVRWQNCPHAIVALRQTSASAQIQRSDLVPVPVGRYRIALLNRAGVALAGSGNGVSWRLLTENVA